MKNNVYTIISYNNYELKLLVCGFYFDRVFILFEKVVEKVDINNLNSDLKKDKLSVALNEIYSEACKITKNDDKKVYLVYDPEMYYYNSKNLVYEYPETHVVKRSDLDKVYDIAMHEQKAQEGFVSVDFNIKKIAIDNKKEVKNPLGMSVDKLEAYGEVIYSDAKTFYNLMEVVESYGLKVQSKMLGGYLLKEVDSISNNQGIMEIGTQKINFVVKINNEIKQFSLNLGMQQIFETVYQKLTNKYSNEESEQTTRFLMDYFVLYPYASESKINQNIDLNEAVECFKTVIIEKFNFVFSEIAKKEIICESYQLIVHEYPDSELLKLLNENLSIKFESFIINDLKHIQTGNIKAVLAIKQFNRYITMEKR